MAIWWCNQARDWQQERQAGVVCASEMTNNTFRKTVGDARAGDIIVHYRRPRIVAFSQALGNGMQHAQLPLVAGVNYGKGWRFQTEYWDLQHPIHRNKFRPELIRTPKPLHYPIQQDGSVMQGYFFPFDEDGLRHVLRCVTDSPLPQWLMGDIQVDNIGSAPKPEEQLTSLNTANPALVKLDAWLRKLPETMRGLEQLVRKLLKICPCPTEHSFWKLYLVVPQHRNKIIFNVRACGEATVWQYSRFSEDQEYWESRLGKHINLEIKVLTVRGAHRTSLQFQLTTKEHFQKFWHIFMPPPG